MSPHPPAEVERSQSPPLLRPMLFIVGAAALGLFAIWAVAVPIGPEVCGLSYPGPRNCFTHSRLDAAILPTVLIGSLLIVSLLAIAIFSRARTAIWTVSVALLIVLSVISYVRVAWIPALA